MREVHSEIGAHRVEEDGKYRRYDRESATGLASRRSQWYRRNILEGMQYKGYEQKRIEVRQNAERERQLSM